MGDLFGAFQKVSPQNKNNSFDQIAAYEEYYMKLLKRYQGDSEHRRNDGKLEKRAKGLLSEGIASNSKGNGRR